MELADTPPADEQQTTQPQTNAAVSSAALQNKWGDAINLGFVAIPNVLITNFRGLNVTPTEFVVLLNLLTHWWSVEDRPYPRVATIARRLDMTTRTVQRALNRLKALGLLDWERIQVRSGKIIRNAPAGDGVRRRLYDLRPLVERANALAQERLKLMPTNANSGGGKHENTA